MIVTVDRTEMAITGSTGVVVTVAWLSWYRDVFAVVPAGDSARVDLLGSTPSSTAVVSTPVVSELKGCLEAVMDARRDCGALPSILSAACEVCVDGITVSSISVVVRDETVTFASVVLVRDGSIRHSTVPGCSNAIERLCVPPLMLAVVHTGVSPEHCLVGLAISAR